MKDKICLQQWVDEQKRLLKSFELMWKSQFLSDPENFPMELPRGEWDEQFDFFVDEYEN